MSLFCALGVIVRGFRMSSTLADSIINALHSLFPSYGLHKEAVSDNGPQFVAKVF